MWCTLWFIRQNDCCGTVCSEEIEGEFLYRYVQLMIVRMFLICYLNPVKVFSILFLWMEIIYPKWIYFHFERRTHNYAHSCVCCVKFEQNHLFSCFHLYIWVRVRFVLCSLRKRWTDNEFMGRAHVRTISPYPNTVQTNSDGGNFESIWMNDTARWKIWRGVDEY